MLQRLFNKTKVKVVTEDHCGSGGVCRVYDTGNGPFIYSFMGSYPRYLDKNGGFKDSYYTCNGDAVSWKIHVGSISDLDFKG